MRMAEIDEERGRANEAIEHLREANRTGDVLGAMVWAGRLWVSRLIVETYLRAWWEQGCCEAPVGLGCGCRFVYGTSPTPVGVVPCSRHEGRR